MPDVTHASSSISKLMMVVMKKKRSERMRVLLPQKVRPNTREGRMESTTTTRPSVEEKKT